VSGLSIVVGTKEASLSEDGKHIYTDDRLISAPHTIATGQAASANSLGRVK
jgi:hypothetical protein